MRALERVEEMGALLQLLALCLEHTKKISGTKKKLINSFRSWAAAAFCIKQSSVYNSFFDKNHDYGGILFGGPQGPPHLPRMDDSFSDILTLIR